MNVEALFAQLRNNSDAEATQEVEKTASAGDEGMEKLASELYAGGQLFAEGFVDRFIEKLAAGVPAGGRGLHHGSNWQNVTSRIAKLKGEHMTVGDNTSVRAEEEAISGAKGVVNPQKPLPKGGM